MEKPSLCTLGVVFGVPEGLPVPVLEMTPKDYTKDGVLKPIFYNFEKLALVKGAFAFVFRFSEGEIDSCTLLALSHKCEFAQVGSVIYFMRYVELLPQEHKAQLRSLLYSGEIHCNPEGESTIWPLYLEFCTRRVLESMANFYRFEGVVNHMLEEQGLLG